MTAPARIHQDDMDRAMKAVARSGIERARVVMDLANRRIEVIIGESALVDSPDDGEWDDEAI